MKDSLFELLLDLFEKTITQLKEQYPEVLSPMNPSDEGGEEQPSSQLIAVPSKKAAIQMAIVQSASEKAYRVFTPDERVRLTKVSYQFLHRLTAWGLVSNDTMELILNRLMFSDTHVISLSEVKWTVRNTLASMLDAEQLAFLDLVLYQKEHGFSLN